jgi:hypothetical protein
LRKGGEIRGTAAVLAIIVGRFDLFRDELARTQELLQQTRRERFERLIHLVGVIKVEKQHCFIARFDFSLKVVDYERTTWLIPAGHSFEAAT